MWAGNQAGRLIGRKTEAVRQEKRSCALNGNVFIHPPHSDNVRSTLGLMHSSQSTGGLFTLFVKTHLCFSKPVKVLICVLAGLFRRWLLLGLRKGAPGYARVLECLVCVVYVCTLAQIGVCRDCNEAYFGLWVLWFDWAARQLHTETPCLLICSHPTN